MQPSAPAAEQFKRSMKARHQAMLSLGDMISIGLFFNTGHIISTIGTLPILMTMMAVNFAFSGTELIGIVACETENPEKVVRWRAAPR